MRPLSLVHVEGDGQACEGSYTVVVVSEVWEGRPPLERARTVNELLKAEIARMHAVSVKCWTPAQWEKHRHAYGY